MKVFDSRFKFTIKEQIQIWRQMRRTIIKKTDNRQSRSRSRSRSGRDLDDMLDKQYYTSSFGLPYIDLTDPDVIDKIKENSQSYHHIPKVEVICKKYTQSVKKLSSEDFYAKLQAWRSFLYMVDESIIKKRIRKNEKPVKMKLDPLEMNRYKSRETLDYYKAGYSQRKIAKLMKFSKSKVARIITYYNKTGKYYDAGAKPTRKFTNNQIQEFGQLFLRETKPSLREAVDQFNLDHEAEQVTVSLGTAHTWRKKLGLSFKNYHNARHAQDEYMEEYDDPQENQTAKWRSEVACFQVNALENHETVIFQDEKRFNNQSIKKGEYMMSEEIPLPPKIEVEYDYRNVVAQMSVSRMLGLFIHEKATRTKDVIYTVACALRNFRISPEKSMIILWDNAVSFIFLY